MNNQRRECTLLRSEEASRSRGWILGNTMIGLVLDVKVCLHLKEKSFPCPSTKERIYDDGSDHSLSFSWAREFMLPEAGAAYHCDVDLRLSSARIKIMSF